MLYLLHKANHPDISYREGQTPIVHLQADMNDVIAWADEKRVKWAFSTANAGARYAPIYASVDKLSEVSWTAVMATDFRKVEIKEGKQAEFLVFQSLPWSLVEKVGVVNGSVLAEAKAALAAADHQPPISLEPDWYY